MPTPFNVLFLCTGNSARSILAEATLNHLAAKTGRFHAWSAGSAPKAAPNPLAIALLNAERISTAGLASKRWDVFAAPDAPPIHLVVTVCDAAAGEACPLYPGKPLKAHWGVPDPHTADEFRAAYRVLRTRIERLLAAPAGTMSAEALEKLVQEIGNS